MNAPDVADQDNRDTDNWIERNSKTITTLATVSIPIVLAIMGFIANGQISKQQLDKEYVNLAIGILHAETNVNESVSCKDATKRLTDEQQETTAKQTAELIEADPNEELADLPKTLLRKWALDLLLETTPDAVQLTSTQYVGLLCGERITALTADEVTPADSDDQTDAASVLFQQLEEDPASATGCLVVSTDTPTVGGLPLGPRSYIVELETQVSTTEAAEAPTMLQYVKISPTDETSGVAGVWVLVGPTAQWDPESETCE